ncbi:MAG TPA: HAD family hydrolase [Gemmataceae bacterium]|jgi:phosphoglycolate phosphatase-like HAD superfamily hydrolase
MLPDPAIEVLRPGLPRGRFRAVLFDFDGTLSLLREGWPKVMTEMMLEELHRTGANQPEDRFAATVEAIVVGLNGRPTIVQMQHLAAEIERLGGQPAAPATYARQYQERLMRIVQGRYDRLRTGRAAPAEWAVPGCYALLNRLRARGLPLVLASGTEAEHVRREAELLKLNSYFGEAIFAPDSGDPHFSKRAVIEHVLREHGLRGEELLAFGDGVVETEEVRRVGGVAVAVASEEPPRRGVNARKRDRLIRAGADVVIADYECHERLLRWLFAED